MSCTMPCSEAFRANLTAYDRALEDVKDKNYKPYILAAGNYVACLFMTLPFLPPLPSYTFSPRPSSTSPSLLPTSLPSSHVPSFPVSRPHPPPSTPFLPSTLPPPQLLPFPSCRVPLPHIILPPSPLNPVLSIFPLPPIALPLFLLARVSFHSLCIRESGSCLILLDLGLHCVSVCLCVCLHCVSVCMFLSSLPRPLGN